MNNDEIRRGLESIPGEEYPKDLLFLRKTEYVTQVKTLKKRPGCPLTILTLITIIMFLLGFRRKNDHEAMAASKQNRKEQERTSS